MIRLFSSVFLALLLPVAAAAAAPSDPIIQEVSQANARVQLATKNHDVKTLSRLITPDYFLVGSNGHVYDRAAFLTDIADTSATYEINQTEFEHVQHYNADSALFLAVLHIRYRAGSKVVDVRVRFTDTWVKLNGQWRYAAGQATLIKKPSP